ncbi:MAG TPA: heme-copper oxidase subunit III [Opitutaceae bacterium]|nr:heme-copper oxidase subunit III [Opitutaceae bacterium]
MSSHAAHGPIDHHHDATTSTGIPNKKLFMWTFLASDCMFFGVLISTHVIYRIHPPAGSPDPRSIFSIELTSFSTFILLMSSLLMALAVNAIQKGNVRSTRNNLLGTIFFGLIFLACQVYEFQHFVHERNLTLSNSIFGSTFYTLTGTHGCHVAIGVLWLILMYIRTFKPVNADSSTKPWFIMSLVHFAVFAVAVVLGVYVVVEFAHKMQVAGFSVGGFFSGHLIPIVGFLASMAGLYALGRSSGQVDFNESHAIDVESMGLYWHFVDIVWIIIFPVVYLLEYI